MGVVQSNQGRQLKQHEAVATANGVHRIATCSLHRTSGTWAFGERERAAGASVRAFDVAEPGVDPFEIRVGRGGRCPRVFPLPLPEKPTACGNRAWRQDLRRRGGLRRCRLGKNETTLVRGIDGTALSRHNTAPHSIRKPPPSPVQADLRLAVQVVRQAIDQVERPPSESRHALAREWNRRPPRREN